MNPRPLLVLGALGLAAASFILGSTTAQGPSAALPTAPRESLATTGPSPTVRPRVVGLPDPRLTPGSINPNVTQANIDRTICVAGWAERVRPPSAYTSGLKVAQIALYGYADDDPAHYQEDHLVPLQLGGAPRDTRNLWPLPLSMRLPNGEAISGLEKDDLGDELKRRVCSTEVLLDDAQRAIAGDWIQAWESLGRP